MVTPDFNKINPVVRKDSSVSSADDTRKPPQGDFDKVAKEVDDREKEGGDKDSLMKKDKKPVAAHGFSEKTVAKDVSPLLSPFQLARGYQKNSRDGEKESDTLIDTPKPKKVQAPVFTPEPVAQTTVPIMPLETHVESKTVNPRYTSVEQPDLTEVDKFGKQVQPAYVPPVFAIDASMTTDAPVVVNTPQPLQTIQEVIDQIVKNVYTLKQAGDTQVVVDLKGNLEGSHLIVTESDLARGQFNITIDNLTGANQALIEASRAKIMDALLESGVQVQRFTASTTVETRIDVAAGDTRERGGRDSNPQQNNPGDERRQKSNDNT